MAKGNKLALMGDTADLQRMEAALQLPDPGKAKSRHTIIHPVEVYVEAEGGR